MPSVTATDVARHQARAWGFDNTPHQQEGVRRVVQQLAAEQRRLKLDWIGLIPGFGGVILHPALTRELLGLDLLDGQDEPVRLDGKLESIDAGWGKVRINWLREVGELLTLPRPAITGVCIRPTAWSRDPAGIRYQVACRDRIPLRDAGIGNSRFWES